MKVRSNNTVLEYRTDILHFFSYVAESRSQIFMDFINSITLTDMYGCITHCPSVLHSSARDNCIITIFLNCGLRLSELAGLNVSQINSDVLTVIGKGNKERRIFVTPAVKQSLAQWLPIRNMLEVHTDALFVSKNHQRITTRAIQNVVKQHSRINMDMLIFALYNKFLVMKALLPLKYIRILTRHSFKRSKRKSFGNDV